jgi:hypothetical protein
LDKVNLLERAAALGLTEEQLKLMAAEYSRHTKESQEDTELLARSVAARELPFGVEGFKNFYWCIWRMELQPYAIQWVKDFATEEWTILECFRGSGKSTDLTITFSLYCEAKEPWSSTLIIQANDDTANRSSSIIATIIEFFDGWKLCFPTIVPDPARGWGAKGYFIKDTSYEYGKWLEMCARDHTKDPSFVGSGLGSSDIRGMHPRRIFFDDIHDINNSAFPKERKKIVDIVKTNILPVLMKPATQTKPWVGVACTPWSDDDAYQELFSSGLFKRHVTPLYWHDSDGKYEIDDMKVSLAWEEGFPIENILMMKKLYKGSRVQWAREYLCDRSAAKNVLYKWYSFPDKDVDLYTNPVVGGVDYASVFLATNQAEGGISYFAMAYAMKLSMGAVIADGILDQCTQAQAETYVLVAQNTFPGWEYAVVESVGEGRQFVQLMQRNPHMRILPARTGDVFRGTKEARQYEILSPLLERAILRISDADTPFLNTLRSYFTNYPNIDRHAPEWDVADAVLWAVVGIPELGLAVAMNENSALPYSIHAKKKSNSWLASLGNARK